MIDIAELIQKIYNRAKAIGLSQCRVYLVPPYKGTALWHTAFSYPSRNNVGGNGGGFNSKFANRLSPDEGLREILEVLNSPDFE